MAVRITRDAIDPAAVLTRVGASEHGAEVLFLGVVRDHNEGRAVASIRYEAYEAMAERVLATLVAEAEARRPGIRIAAVHRVGELRVGEVSLAVAVSSAHRPEAFDAARELVEEIKRRLPVWKEEHYTDGERRWLDGHTPPVPEAAR
ncbi:MAG TPA: molybdenum cofactor biosynthesis protein MoaE [Longimicrobiales bacterium]